MNQSINLKKSKQILKILPGGNYEIPKRFRISQKKRRLVIKTPYSVEVHHLLKNGQLSITSYFRERGKDKEYIPWGTLQLDDTIFNLGNAVEKIV